MCMYEKGEIVFLTKEYDLKLRDYYSTHKGINYKAGDKLIIKEGFFNGTDDIDYSFEEIERFWLGSRYLISLSERRNKILNTILNDDK